MAVMMPWCHCRHHEWMGVEKRPQIMSSVDDGKAQTWKKQKTTSLREEVAAAASVSVSVSVERAMRAAMLKTRFADTISKAKLALQGGDVSSLQQQRPPQQHRLNDHTRKTRSEVQIKAAYPRKEDLKKCHERERKAAKVHKCHERERKAARMALEKMEKSVNVDENAASMLRDLEKLIGLPFGTGLGYPDTKQLERLGLYIKDILN